MAAPVYQGQAQAPDSQRMRHCASLSICVHGADVLEMCAHRKTFELINNEAFLLNWMNLGSDKDGSK